MERFNFVATSLFGLEKFTNDTIKDLGYSLDGTHAIDGRSFFLGDLDAIPRCNMHLATAERLYILLGEFPCQSFDDLFEGTKALDWERWIGKNDIFPVKGHAIQSKLSSIPDCQSIVKKAVVDRLGSKYNISWFQETGVKYQIEFFIFKDTAYLMIDTTGEGLHKRGYRPHTADAPLRETLAAALVRIARASHSVVLHDPMCGSGTIPIETALYLTNTPPGINRKFACSAFPQIPEELWNDAREDAISEINCDPYEIIGSDINPQAIDIAKQNAKRAGVKGISFKTMDVKDVTSQGKRGTIICNPPYGERLMSMEAVSILYAMMGKTFASLEGWHSYILTSDELFERYYGRRADKVRKLYNGMIKCNLYQYFKRR